ncbi:hypothetical protein [Eleftheria terrae]|uniref:hypothetical protein n=1 Tax=Eleftheria terrae TaxID=1597781 RepID=UPI00263B9B10|nr:hypothetical protein [Eleftheria terrae]WKB56111.1 hypothetical protein N7L95_29080 [Eleftheria terrae]
MTLNVISPGTAQGGTQASASWSGLSFQVNDLRPADNLPAWFEMTPANENMDQSFVASVLEKGDRAGTIWWDGRTEAKPFAPMSATVSLDGRHAAAEIDAQGNGSASASLEVRGKASSAARVMRYSSDRWEPPEGGFLLAPYSTLTISLLASVKVEDAGLLDGVESHARAHAFLSAVLPDWGGSATSVWDRAELNTTEDSFSDLLSTSRHLTILVVNNTADVQRHRLYVEVGTAVSAVPEPGTVVLALVGGAVLWASRGRRRPQE